MQDKLKKMLNDSVDVKKQALDSNLDIIQKAVNIITEAFRNNKKLIIFGNGGSAADSQHIAAEFIGRFKKERVSLPAIALTTDSSILTALANDYGFDVVFSRQIEGLGSKGDIVLGISTSGNSKNVVNGLNKAKELGLTTISLIGCDGGEIAKLTDISIIVPSKDTARIQESHLFIAHAICELVEMEFIK